MLVAVIIFLALHQAFLIAMIVDAILFLIVFVEEVSFHFPLHQVSPIYPRLCLSAD